MGYIHSRLSYMMAAILILTGLVTLSACSSGYGAPSTSTSAAPPAGNTISIANFAFSPSSLTIKVGTTVTWTNKDSTAHTVTSDTGNVLNSGNMAQNATFSFTFNSAGTFNYHCAIHPNMKGTIVVQ
jgi:amicyanin